MFVSIAAASLSFGAAASKTFDVPADDASRALHRFSAQADQQILFSDGAVAGIRTNAVKGTFTPREALDRMLANTGLVANHNDGAGAIAVSRPKDLPKKDPDAARPAAGVNERDAQKKNGIETPPTQEPMKRNKLLTRLAAALGLLVAAAEPAAAQSPPTGGPFATSPAEEKAIELSPFTVSADADVGYIAQNTLAGTRLNTSLKDTAAAISVLTSEFLSDIGANNLEEAMAWSVNSQLDQQDTLAIASSGFDDNNTFYHFGNFRVRGLEARRTRNYFLWRLPSDSYNIERVEESRGPNSVLYGIGPGGGVVNTSTKRALFGRNIRRASVQVGSYESYRGTIDLNQQVGDKLAVRFNGVFTESNSFREYVRSDNRLGHVNVACKPLKKTRIWAEYETGIIDQVIPMNDPVKDRFSAWTTLGSQIITDPNSFSGKGVGRRSAAVQVSYILNNNSLMNEAREFTTNGTDNYAFSYDPRLADSSVNPGGPGAVRRGDYDTAALFIEQQIGKNTFVELAYNRQDNRSISYMPAGGSNRLQGDPNATLPNGQPNPFVGGYYFEGTTETWNIGRKSESLRATISTDLDFRRWGKYRLAGLAEREERRNPDDKLTEVWEGSPFHSVPENAANWVRRRNYVTPGSWGTFYRSMPKETGLIRGLVDPVTGRMLSSTMVPADQFGTKDQWADQDTVLLAAQARFFKDRLVFGAGYRWDALDIENYGSVRNSQTQFWEVDYSKPRGTRKFDGQTRTLGVVGHVTKNLSLFYNKADTISLPDLSIRLLPAGDTPPNPDSIGQDYGIALDLFEGKLFARASYYKVDVLHGVSRIYNGTLNSPGMLSRIILNALVDQQIITESQAAPHRVFENTGAITNRLVEGYELNLTANPTKNWRLQANFSLTDGFVSDVAPEVKAWVSEHLPFLQNPAYQNVVGTENARSVAEILAEFSRYDGEQREAEGLVLPGNRKYKANLFTSYNFSEGALKGLTIGGGYNWQDKMAVGFLELGQLRYSKATWNTNLMVGYRFRNVSRLPWVKNLRLQLNVLNVTDDDDPMIYRYASNDSTSPEFNVIRRIRVKDPRSWRLTANFDF